MVECQSEHMLGVSSKESEEDRNRIAGDVEPKHEQGDSPASILKTC